MPAQYAPLPNPRSHSDGDEMEAAFEASDDEDEGDVRTAESRPLNPSRNYSTHDGDPHDDDRDADTTALQQLGGGTFSGTHIAHARTRSAGPGSYDFENIDYDFPPPGSPPRRDRALPNNDWGNSNGVLPSTSVARPRPRAAQGFGWVRRVLPARVTRGLVRQGERGRVVGGGGELDGVFANVTAKPTAPMQIREEDGIYVQPEDAQKDAPPSYASAQADSVPPYWETTIHAPSSLSPGMMIPGELPIDGLATGTLFSFMWNMLVSISFQFVGFLLTYLLHTTHAAKLGARAGLGLTLVQYGFALRTGRDGSNEDGGIDGGASNGMIETFTEPIPSFNSGAEADAWFADHPNATMLLNPALAGGNVFSSDMTTEWLAFLLMTIGWFVLLNSLLGFWRIKRLERSILASHEEQPDRATPIPLPVGTSGGGHGHGRQSSFAVHFERTLGLRLPTISMIQSGLGLRPRGGGDVDTDAQLLYEYDGDFNRVRTGGRRGDVERDSLEEETETEVLLAIPEGHPERERLIAEALANERRLQQDLRAAGLL